MTKKKKFFITVICVSCIVVFLGTIIHSIIYPKYEVKEGSIEKYNIKAGSYFPKEGYVPNAEIAINIAKVVSAVTFPELKKGGGYEVEYDKKSEVWIVCNYKMFRSPIYVFISKKDGRILSILAYK